MNTSGEQNLPMYISHPHECAYLPEQQSSSLFVDPAFPVDTQLYGLLLQNGFRRSGDLVYRPHCEHCNACIPIRIPVDRFQPGKTQKRIWRKNRDLEVRTGPPEYSDAHFELYCRYQRARHRDGTMDNPDPERYRQFLLSQHIDGMFLELYLDDVLLAVAVADRVADGLSAVYTFFDPEYDKRSLGVYAVLLEIEEARTRGLDWLYLGYWIRECRKMSYKNQYRPFQIFKGEQWLEYDDGEVY